MSEILSDSICKCGHDLHYHTGSGCNAAVNSEWCECEATKTEVEIVSLREMARVFVQKSDTAQMEITQLREALTQANELYNAVEAMNLELTERIAQDELAFGFMREANTLLTADVKRLTAELVQCKHALDDEVCECGRPLDEHEGDGLHPCKESGCLMFWLVEEK